MRILRAGALWFSTFAGTLRTAVLRTVLWVDAFATVCVRATVVHAAAVPVVRAVRFGVAAARRTVGTGSR